MATARNKLNRIEKRKRLDALFDRGGYVRFNRDANGNPVIDPEVESSDDFKIWVGPPSPLQREMAVREAQAHRARVMIEARDNDDSATSVTIKNYIRSLSTETLIDYLAGLEETEFTSQARRDVLVRKEWEDFDALRDAMRQFDESGAAEDDEEWKSLMERDREFTKQVLDRAIQIKNDARAGYALMPRLAVEEKAIEKRIEQAGSIAFMEQYEEWMLFYACRDDEDHSLLMFDDVNDMKSQPEEIQEALAVKLTAFIQDTAEAKN